MSSTSSPSQRTTLVLSVVVGLVVAAALGIALLGGDPPDGFDLDEIAAPSVAGGPVSAQGDAAPTAVGEALLADDELTLPVDGEPTLLVFLAHWCPACNAEVPELVEWLEEGNLPDDVELRGVVTAIDPVRDNYPPTQWLERRDWDVPTLVDTDGSVAEAYGLTGFPFWAVVNADGEVVGATSGQLGADGFDQLVELARS